MPEERRVRGTGEPRKQLIGEEYQEHHGSANTDEEVELERRVGGSRGSLFHRERDPEPCRVSATLGKDQASTVVFMSG